MDRWIYCGGGGDAFYMSVHSSTTPLHTVFVACDLLGTCFFGLYIFWGGHPSEGARRASGGIRENLHVLEIPRVLIVVM